MSYKIIGKYIQDLNFRIPNPKTFFLLSKDISNYKISVDIKSNQIKQNIIEVLTSLTLSPSTNDFEKINTKKLKNIIKGIIKGCKLADCDLVGGETAKMPGTYTKGKFDIAGFSEGFVEKDKILINKIREK